MKRVIGNKNDRKVYILDATRKDDYMGGPGDEESNSGVFLPEGRNFYKKADSSPHSAGLSVNHILDKVRYIPILNHLQSLADKEAELCWKRGKLPQRGPIHQYSN